MENNLSVPNVPVTPSQQASPISVQSNNSKTLIVSLVALEVVTLLVAGYFGYQLTQLKKQTPTTITETSIIPTYPSPVPSLSSDKTSAWQVQRVQGLGIEFKLPNYLSQMDYPNGNETKGEKGKQFCIQYEKVDIVSFLVKDVLAGGGACLPTYFGLGTTSVDYEAGRMGGFGDLQGYTYENGKYFAKMVLGKKFEIPSELAQEITNPNGVKILKIIGKNEQSSAPDIPSFPIAGTPGNGSLGALINLNNNSTYSGVAVEMKIGSKLNQELFDQILSTIKLTN